jgi:hypothetical protein
LLPRPEEIRAVLRRDAPFLREPFEPLHTRR